MSMPVRRAPIAMTLASLCSRASLAESGSDTSAQRAAGLRLTDRVACILAGVLSCWLLLRILLALTARYYPDLPKGWLRWFYFGFGFAAPTALVTMRGTVYNESIGISAALILAAFWSFLRFEDSPDSRWPLIAGAAIGAAAFTRVTLILYAVPFFAALAVTIQFVRQMNRMAGANVLRHFSTGVYHRPKAEERVFLFLDLVGSTQLAERLGSARYFELLRRFVDDLTEPVLEAEGEIYQYAGDEVVITWPMAAGLRAANCLRCVFDIHAAVARAAARYERDFGTVPRFRGGLHAGAVTAGELGDLKQQIVFVGDILNTAARLEEYAKRAGVDLVVSGTLLDRLPLPPGVTATPCGELEIRGKEARVRAYSVRVASGVS